MSTKAAPVRIEGVVLRAKSHIFIALQDIYGIGPKRAGDICNKLDIDRQIKVMNLNIDQVTDLQKAVGEYVVEGNLRREINAAIKRLRDIKCYRGLRHLKGLPVRGQRTNTNARTRKGRKGTRKSSSGSGGKK